MSESPKKPRSSRMQRIITGTALAAALVLVLALGGWLAALTGMAALSVALYEELNALRQGGHRPVWWPCFAAMLAGVPMMMYSSLGMVPVMLIACLIILVAVMRREDPELTDILVSVMPMLTLVLPGLCLFGLLAVQPVALQRMLLVCVFASSVGADTFAYFVGSAVGGPKLCPHISPNKTIAGAVGGLLGSVVVTVLAGCIFQWCAPGYAFPPLWANALAGLAGGIAAQLGDLFASLVKRHCKIKDFGHIFPGHGGMLDRMDSVVFTAIVMYCYRVVLTVL